MGTIPRIRGVEMAGLPGLPRAFRPIRTRVRGLHRGFGGPRAPPEASVISKLHHRPALQRYGRGLLPSQELLNSV